MHSMPSASLHRCFKYRRAVGVTRLYMFWLDELRPSLWLMLTVPLASGNFVRWLVLDLEQAGVCVDDILRWVGRLPPIEANGPRVLGVWASGHFILRRLLSNAQGVAG